MVHRLGICAIGRRQTERRGGKRQRCCYQGRGLSHAAHLVQGRGAILSCLWVKAASPVGRLTISSPYRRGDMLETQNSAPCRRRAAAPRLRAFCAARRFKLARRVNFSRMVRDARLKRGLTVADVAERVGVTPTSIYFWETDHCRPRDANLSALCKVLKLPIRATRDIAAA